LLNAIQGFTAAEIAQIVGISLDACKKGRRSASSKSSWSGCEKKADSAGAARTMIGPSYELIRVAQQGDLLGVLRSTWYYQPKAQRICCSCGGWMSAIPGLPSVGFAG
jgi:hypothetical protein